eukprot:g4368.t1
MYVHVGRDNYVLGTASAVAAGLNNRVEQDWGFVGGGQGNRAGGGIGALVAGGSGNQARSEAAAVLGGYLNVAQGSGSVVGGGYSNQAGWDELPETRVSVVAGGLENKAYGDYSSISGGKDNSIARGAHMASIGGGANNKVTEMGARVGGGTRNWASQSYSVVAGGADNLASAAYTTVAGGSGNQAGQSGMNAGKGEGATIGGGMLNKAEGAYSAVPGGSLNVASGAYSFAAGYKAVASEDFTAVFEFGQGISLNPSGGPVKINNFAVMTVAWASLGLSVFALLVACVVAAYSIITQQALIASLEEKLLEVQRKAERSERLAVETSFSLRASEFKRKQQTSQPVREEEEGHVRRSVSAQASLRNDLISPRSPIVFAPPRIVSRSWSGRPGSPESAISNAAAPTGYAAVGENNPLIRESSFGSAGPPPRLRSVHSTDLPSSRGLRTVPPLTAIGSRSRPGTSTTPPRKRTDSGSPDSGDTIPSSGQSSRASSAPVSRKSSRRDVLKRNE